MTKDIWRIIGRNLEKKDLLSLQLAFPEIGKILDRIPEIWHWKHYKYYRDNYKSCQNTRKSLDKDKEEIFDLFAPYMIIWTKVGGTDYRVNLLKNDQKNQKKIEINVFDF